MVKEKTIIKAMAFIFGMLLALYPPLLYVHADTQLGIFTSLYMAMVITGFWVIISILSAVDKKEDRLHDKLDLYADFMQTNIACYTTEIKDWKSKKKRERKGN